MFKRILIISLVINLFFTLLFGLLIHRRGGIPYLTYQLYNSRQVGFFNMIFKDSNDIIFVGDSITAECEWSELFGNPSIKNLGISGNRSDRGGPRKSDSRIKCKIYDERRGNNRDDQDKAEQVFVGIQGESSTRST